MHWEDDTIDEEMGKSHIILDYNKTKGEVDTVDKMCKAFTCSRRINFHHIHNIMHFQICLNHRCFWNLLSQNTI